MNADLWLSLITLALLEIVLGIDNLVFISILSSRLPQHKQRSARHFGLMLALVTRLLLLATATWIATLKHPIMTFLDFSFSWRDLLLISGGLFLLVKATGEIHDEFEDSEGPILQVHTSSFLSVVTQIALLDIIFSLDSVITAVGMTSNFLIMATAIIIAIILMLIASEPLSHFVQRHPTVKMLALCFLMLVGVILIADGFHFYIPRGYLYFAIAFSILVESLNMVLRKRKRAKRKKQQVAH